MRGVTARGLVDKIYEAAYFWHISPLEIFNLPIGDIVDLLNQAARICAEINKAK